MNSPVNLIVKGVVVLIAIPTAFFAFIIFLYTVGIPFHDARLLYTRMWYAATIPHPPSRLVSRFSEIGNFGNSNHCDYAVGEIRVSPWDTYAIKKFYETMPIGAIVGKENKGEAISISALFPEDTRNLGSWFAGAGGPLHGQFEDLASATATDGTIYMVAYVDSMYPAGFDYRCH
jgi:hypothetical protein